MSNNNKYVIGIDLDGTTLMEWDGKLNEHGRRVDSVHLETIDAVKKLQDMGHHIVINTGRNWEEAKSIYELLGLNSFIVNSAGAYVHNPSDSSFEPIQAGMPNEMVKEMLNDEYFMDGVVGWGVDIDNTFHMHEDSTGIFRETGLKYWVVEFFNGEFDFNPESGVFHYGNSTVEHVQDRIDYAREKWGDIIHATNWGTTGGVMFGIEINPAHANKGTGLLLVADALGIDHKYTMGFGDGENDLELIRMAEHGVAMSHAVDYIKEHANHVTKVDNNEGGVGLFLKEFFEIK